MININILETVKFGRYIPDVSQLHTIIPMVQE
jgi:hypothetical protein